MGSVLFTGDTHTCKESGFCLVLTIVHGGWEGGANEPWVGALPAVLVS